VRVRTLLAAVVALVACGYHPLPQTVPGGATSVRVELPDPSRIDEPALSAMLAAELCRQLGRSGITASSSGHADAVLRTKILALEGIDPLLAPSGRVLTAQRLKLRLELVLEDARGGTLWRSGLLEVERPWPLDPSAPLTSETSRRQTLLELATHAAEQAVTLLTTTAQR
jgi:Lipopolysaccharide-assembly